ncbi:MAG: glycosyltransferase [Acidobacteria bacterium]|nr:glycosyltransferase [Acidobacteriota bacterium]
MSAVPVAELDARAAVRQALAANPFLAEDAGTARSRPIDVIVPIYNAADDLAACIAGVARHTRCPFRLVLINDGSTDSRVAWWLDGIRGAAARLIVIDRPDNRGFVRTVNEGFALSPDADAVVLNSDTIVSAGWLEKMAAVARSRPDVATVTPLTNNGTICSVPIALEDNALPAGYDVDSFAALVETTSFKIFPEAPTGVGFCMLITRRALDAVGPFDATAFGDGYGEENDFCQRAMRAGLVNLIADHTFVYHKGRASFGERGDGLIARNLETLTAKHPAYDADVARFCRNHPLRGFHVYLGYTIAAGRGRRGAIGARVLHILHGGGGTEKHARELAAMEDPSVLSYVLLSDGRTLDVDEYYAGRRTRPLRFPLPTAIGKYGPLRSSAYRDALTAIGWTLDVDIIHVHHLMYNALDIADVAETLGIPYVMTLHDYHTLCPMYTLLAPDGLPGGACTGSPHRSAEACMRQAGQPASYLAEYQAQMRRFLGGAAQLFVPSACAREIVGARFPEVMPVLSVIEHGHRATEPEVGEGPHPSLSGRTPGSDKGESMPTLNVAVIGSLDVHKGSAVFRDLLRANRRDELVFHLYGTTADPDITRARQNQAQRLDGSRFVYHGAYKAKDIVRTLVRDGVDVGLHLSVWPETFSYTLSEFVNAGIPVIAGRLGAQGERIERCRLGWTVADIRDPAATLAILDDILRRPATLREMASAMRRDEALVPIDTMWGRYRDIYRSLARPRGTETTVPARGEAYVAFLATRLAETANADATTAGQTLQDLRHELDGLKERFRSPRHRIAEAVANAIQKTPLLWPLVRSVTEAVLRRR